MTNKEMNITAGLNGGFSVWFKDSLGDSGLTGTYIFCDEATLTIGLLQLLGLDPMHVKDVLDSVHAKDVLDLMEKEQT